jgi:hypothetical protein
MKTMNTSAESLVEREEHVEELDFVEMGDVSVETKGGILGHRLDGGFGYKV